MWINFRCVSVVWCFSLVIVIWLYISSCHNLTECSILCTPATKSVRWCHLHPEESLFLLIRRYSVCVGGGGYRWAIISEARQRYLSGKVQTLLLSLLLTHGLPDIPVSLRCLPIPSPWWDLNSNSPLVLWDCRNLCLALQRFPEELLASLPIRTPEMSSEENMSLLRLSSSCSSALVVLTCSKL